MSTKGKEYKLAIRIAGVIDKSFTTSLTAANSTLKKTMLSMDKDFTMMDKGFNKITGVAKKGFSAIATAAGVAATAIGAATAAAVSVGSEFESAFASVKKTVDATEEGYAQLKQDILDMAKVIPESQAAIAEVMAIAGQLGIDDHGLEALREFTETMIDLGVSTNLSAEEAATALAKFANITGMDAANYERLGSVIVDLGNNFATTEADIVQMATRLASTGDLVGLSEAQIMALSTAMSSVGIASESGGSTMSKMLKKMQLAVETNSDSLAGYAAVAGMTGEQFKQTFQEDAVVALSAFIDGIDDVERNGKSAVAILDEMGLNEIRLSNTILALAGGEEVMSNAIATANEAWEENTALAVEAGKRYETTASQIQLMKNDFKELGIVAYDDLREPFVGTIGTIREKVQGLTEYVGGPDGISEWIKNIGTELPTLQRKFKKFGEPVFNGIVGAGKWIAKNGNLVISLLAGVGAALATYKIASTITHIVTSLMSLGGLNPVTQGIMVVVGAIGLLSGAIALYEQNKRNLIDESLAEHFGSIALSMEEIRAVAEHILSSDSLGGVKEALEAFEDLDVISSTMENSIEELNKMNWKVSIGMELTPEEQEGYKAAIEEYVTAAQEYALQSQYAVSINLSAGLGEDSDVADKVNQFYLDSYNTMVSLGQELSDAVNEAFADNVLDPEEIDNIAHLQAKMAELQASLATGEFEATMAAIQMDYTANGKMLDPDSFLNLTAELDKQVAAAQEAYRESYIKNRAALSASLEGAELEGALAELDENYKKNIADLNEKSALFSLNTIMDNYAEHLYGNLPDMRKAIEAELSEGISRGYTSADDWTNVLYRAMVGASSSTDISRGDRLALMEMYELLQDDLAYYKSEAAKYVAESKEIPANISEAIDNIYSIGAVAGDEGALYQMIGNQIGDSEHFATLIATAREAGAYIPQEIMDAMTDDGVMAQINENVDYILESVKTGLEEGVDVYIPVYYDLVAMGIKGKRAGVPASDYNLNTFGDMSAFDDFINNRATGGLATKPELTWFAENGPEMAIPIDGSRNAISLWRQTGRLLGMGSAIDGLDLGGGSSSPSIAYSPTLQFYGEAPSRGDLEDALRVSQDEFESLMDRYFKTHGRVSFG